ncbi:MAG: TIGR01777 family protein [Chitinophagaceae bacterium]|nr:TIGR01777 family protein [Chitinophagaceae bacterium]
MKNSKIVIAGGSGFIGQAIAKFFGKENHIVILSRQSINGHRNVLNRRLIKASQDYNITYWRWDGEHVEKHWACEIDGADLVINLAGKSVNCRYTAQNKKEIFDSRINSTNVIGEAVRMAVNPPKLWINASSATIYRHADDKPQDEYNGEYQDDFSVQVCKRWEKAFFDQRTPFTRKVALRMAITLGTGGVMIPYFNLLKFGLGGYQGNGKQMYSWVHVDDVCRTIDWMFNNPDAEGVFNCSSPQPVTNKIFMSTLRKITQHTFGLPAFSPILKIGAALIGTEKELILKSRWVLPKKLLESGFQFKYADLDAAIKALIQETPRKKYHLF